MNSTQTTPQTDSTYGKTPEIKGRSDVFSRENKDSSFKKENGKENANSGPSVNGTSAKEGKLTSVTEDKNSDDQAAKGTQGMQSEAKSSSKSQHKTSEDKAEPSEDKSEDQSETETADASKKLNLVDAAMQMPWVKTISKYSGNADKAVRKFVKAQPIAAAAGAVGVGLLGVYLVKKASSKKRA
jgi:hypothetical protein